MLCCALNHCQPKIASTLKRYNLFFSSLRTLCLGKCPNTLHFCEIWALIHSFRHTLNSASPSSASISATAGGTLCCAVVRFDHCQPTMRNVKPFQLFLNLLKATKEKQGRLLGLDVGDKYVGIAVSDFDNKVASPFSVLVRTKTNINLMASDFNELISELSLKGFIVGLPYDRHRVSAEAVHVKAFIDDLRQTRKLEGLKYAYWNESFTSQNVELLLKPLNINNPVQYKTMLDKFAAVGILQGYLDYVNRKKKQQATQELSN